MLDMQTKACGTRGEGEGEGEGGITDNGGAELKGGHGKSRSRLDGPISFFFSPSFFHFFLASGTFGFNQRINGSLGRIAGWTDGRTDGRTDDRPELLWPMVGGGPR